MLLEPGPRVGWDPGCSWVLHLPRDPSAESSSSVKGGEKEEEGNSAVQVL